jgi:threonyl-tRNA synthetase
VLRPRGFTQDDAHIFCRPDQVEDEILLALQFALDLLGAFGFTEFHAYLATRPREKAVGSREQWERAQAALRKALEMTGTPFDVDEGGGTFYGPKIDLKIRDALDREWQCSTIQFDFNLPERFDIAYIGEDNARHQPYMVHRALYGSIERFFAVLVEHYAGAFPTWLAPAQAVVLPIADRHTPYAEAVTQRLVRAGFRAETDGRRAAPAGVPSRSKPRNERLQARIRDAQLQKIPYMLVVGDREADAGTAAVRLRSGEDLGSLPLEEVVAMIGADVETRGAAV